MIISQCLKSQKYTLWQLQEKKLFCLSQGMFDQQKWIWKEMANFLELAFKIKKDKMLTCWEYVRLWSPVNDRHNDLVEKQHARIPGYCTVVILAIILAFRIWSHQRRKKSGYFCKTQGKNDLPDGTWHDYWC